MNTANANLARDAGCYTRNNMPLKPELLEILVCPLCKASLEVKPNETGLKCTQCKRVYPVRDGIPVMLVDQAVVEE